MSSDSVICVIEKSLVYEKCLLLHEFKKGRAIWQSQSDTSIDKEHDLFQRNQRHFNIISKDLKVEHHRTRHNQLLIIAALESGSWFFPQKTVMYSIYFGQILHPGPEKSIYTVTVAICGANKDSKMWKKERKKVRWWEWETKVVHQTLTLIEKNWTYIFVFHFNQSSCLQTEAPVLFVFVGEAAKHNLVVIFPQICRWEEWSPAPSALAQWLCWHGPKLSNPPTPFPRASRV